MALGLTIRVAPAAAWVAAVAWVQSLVEKLLQAKKKKKKWGLNVTSSQHWALWGTH